MTNRMIQMSLACAAGFMIMPTANAEPTAAELPILPAPPAVVTIDQTDANQGPMLPLSELGEQVLGAICEGNLEVAAGLSVMPDLSHDHIEAACPHRLDVQAAQLESTIQSPSY